MTTDDRLDDLLERVGAGDEAAAEEVFRTYEPYLRRVVRRQLPPRLRARFDSADVVQSAWADVLEGFRQGGYRFPDESRLRAFLVRAARNRFLDRYRQHDKAAAREQSLAGGGPEPVSPDPRPSQVVGADDLWTQLLALCPPAHRTVLHLKREGVPVPEIAARTGLHEDSVRRLLRELARRLALREGGAPASGE
jgi:RNA polymerase sigma-70 factor (ECF subfamily)